MTNRSILAARTNAVRARTEVEVYGTPASVGKALSDSHAVCLIKAVDLIEIEGAWHARTTRVVCVLCVCVCHVCAVCVCPECVYARSCV